MVVRPPLSIPPAESRSDQVRLLTESLADELEELILEAPEQWHMVQPFWLVDRDE